jgi:hypothetical protein
MDLSHAVDSGMVSYDPDEREIGLVPVLFNIFNITRHVVQSSSFKSCD